MTTFQGGSVKIWTKKLQLLIVLTGVAIASAVPQVAQAHGERAQEPFLRMRTIQWYDVEWTKSKVAVNEEVVVKGKFRVSPDENWPRTAAKPDLAFLNISSPGPVFVRKASFINGVNMANSSSFQTGRDYAWEVTLKGRYPGKWHIHSMLNIKDAGPLVGPGDWIEVTGNHADFKNEVKTLTGETIDLNTYGMANNIRWHIIWAVFGVAWLLYWLAKPLFFSRYRKVAAGEGASLITKTDQTVAVVVLVGALGLTYFGYQWAEAKWPITLPLQSAQETVAPLPTEPTLVDVKLIRATYRVPGRSLNMTLEVTNNTGKAVRMGEFNTATVRFLNPEVGIMDEMAKKYPKYLLADKGLTLADNKPIEPGETRKIEVEAQDAAWETERLSSLIYDPDSRFGGMFFFYDTDGKRHIQNVGGVLVPSFTGKGGKPKDLENTRY